MRIRYVSEWDNKSYMEDYKRFLAFRKAMDYTSRCCDIVPDSLEFECLSCGSWTKMQKFPNKGGELPFMKRKRAIFFCEFCMKEVVKNGYKKKKD